VINTAKNPDIWLYHGDSRRTAEEILREGFDPNKKTALPISRNVVDDMFPIRKKAIYFFKGRFQFPGNLDVKVKASDIPCRCIQADFNVAGELNSNLRKLDDIQKDPEGSMWKSKEIVMSDIRYYKDEYKKSMQLLDDSPDWCSRHEVLCPCEIPPDVLEPVSLEEDQFLRWRCMGFDDEDEDVLDSSFEDYVKRTGGGE
jgi:hypothetical protein